ncbi:4Fe-4S dicluster domain-containing protein [Loigolactobacillus binensis]|uniref:4Fe-4S dicluster domain-containing protein n=1 Tax=Loigolactobacillus binensis TaxID=2559922 RepID=A0ABW3E8L0_9LACO|nr:4Fe-4S dicluster domain-containing protein [Loigolactobacillus binensis]
MKVTLNEQEYILTPEEEEMSVLEFATMKDVYIPSLCFLKECGNSGKCGVCRVEIEQDGKVKSTLACRLKMTDGLVIRTDTEQTLEQTKKTVIKILNKHDFKCGTCIRNGDCELLALAGKLRARPELKYEDSVDDLQAQIDSRSVGITINRNKCILCGRCAAMCLEKTSTGSIKLQKIDGKRIMAPIDNVRFEDTNCLLYGQCVNACPVGALHETTEIEKVEAALDDDNKQVFYVKSSILGL